MGKMAVPSSVTGDIGGYRVIKFGSLPDEDTTPEEFAREVERISERLLGEELPVLIKGDMFPNWGYAMCVVQAASAPAVAIFDPQIKGYVVVATHDERFKLGGIIPDPESS